MASVERKRHMQMLHGVLQPMVKVPGRGTVGIRDTCVLFGKVQALSVVSAWSRSHVRSTNSRCFAAHAHRSFQFHAPCAFHVVVLDVFIT